MRNNGAYILESKGIKNDKVGGTNVSSTNRYAEVMMWIFRNDCVYIWISMWIYRVIPEVVMVRVLQVEGVRLPHHDVLDHSVWEFPGNGFKKIDIHNSTLIHNI
jgi:hypothetical protein